MITDIRDHGGNYGGSGGIEPRGIQLSGSALNHIKKGDFVSVKALPTSEITYSVAQNANAFAGPSSRYPDFTGMSPLNSDAGTKMILSAITSSSGGSFKFLKPGLNGSGMVNAVVISSTYSHYIFGITKIGPNKFLLIHSTNNIKGLSVSIVEIDDLIGSVKPLITTVINAGYNLKTARYVPFSESGLEGIIVFSTGNYSVGNGDSVTTRLATLSIDDTSNTVSMGTDSTIVYTNGESYGFISNLLYKDPNRVILHTHKNLYTLSWNNGVPTTTVLPTTTNLFSCPVIYDRSKDVIITSNGNMLYKVLYNNKTDTFITTAISVGSGYQELLLAGIGADTVDPAFLLYNYKIINPSLGQSIGFMGNFRIIVIAAAYHSSGYVNRLVLLSLQFDPVFNGVEIANLGYVASFNSTLSGRIWTDFTNDYKSCSFIYPVYWHEDGYANTLNPYSMVLTITKPLFEYSIDNLGDAIQGISIKETNKNGTARGIFKNTSTLKLMLGE